MIILRSSGGSPWNAPAAERAPKEKADALEHRTVLQYVG
jgi:hypothetical protein